MSHYDLLGVPATASYEQVRDAYRALVRKWHPDVAGPEGTHRTAELNEAWRALGDDERRHAYDLTLSPEGDTTPAPAPPPAQDDLPEPGPVPNTRHHVRNPIPWVLGWAVLAVGLAAIPVLLRPGGHLGTALLVCIGVLALDGLFRRPERMTAALGVVAAACLATLPPDSWHPWVLASAPAMWSCLLLSRTNLARHRAHSSTIDPSALHDAVYAYGAPVAGDALWVEDHVCDQARHLLPTTRMTRFGGLVSHVLVNGDRVVFVSGDADPHTISQMSQRIESARRRGLYGAVGVAVSRDGQWSNAPVGITVATPATATFDVVSALYCEHPFVSHRSISVASDVLLGG